MKFLRLGLLCAFLSFFGTSCTTSSLDFNPENVEVKRPVHYFRHFIWSGIFPFGGRIPDPHFLYSNIIEDRGPIAAKLGGKIIRYQFIDINPYFSDESTEKILAIEVEGRVFEITLDLPKNSSVIIGWAEGDHVGVLMETSQNELLYFLTFLDHSKDHKKALTLASIKLPLKSQKVHAVPLNSKEAEALLAKLPKNKASYYRPVFCDLPKGSKEIDDFFERYFAAKCKVDMNAKPRK